MMQKASGVVKGEEAREDVKDEDTMNVLCEKGLGVVKGEGAREVVKEEEARGCQGRRDHRLSR